MGKLMIQEIAKVLVEKNGITMEAAGIFATEMFAIIFERLEQGEQVKVKGLGTFKVIGVEARESVSVRTGERVVIDGHSKVSFIPDATMKELVNRPFSQFETVILNDGVEFDDEVEEMAPSGSPKGEGVAPSEIATPHSVPSENEPDVSEDTVSEDSIVSHSLATPSPLEEPEEASDEAMDEPEEEEAMDYCNATLGSVQEPEEEEAMDDCNATLGSVREMEDDHPDNLVYNNEKGTSMGMKLLRILGVLALMAVSAFVGYLVGHYGNNVKPQPDAVVDTVTIYVRDTIRVVEKQESTQQSEPSTSNATPHSAPSENVKQPAPKVEQPPKADVKAEKPKQDKKADAAELHEKYAKKDARVRLGAYRIVGLEREVKVRAGQTFYSICRANLGPDMECYVEVFNDLPSKPTIKEGQIIKIPKLELKKRKKASNK